MNIRTVKKELIPLGIILLIALSIRLWSIRSALPYIYHPDEPVYINIIQQIFKTGDLNPHFFNYPSLFFYVNSLAYIPYYLFGKAIGFFSTRADILPSVSLAMGVTLAQRPSAVVLSRLVTVFFGVGTVGLTYLAGKKVTSKISVGLLAAAMVAVFPANVWHSRFITPDTFVAFFALAVFLTSMLIYQQGKLWQYILAGLCVGFTASTKYNGALIIIPLILAHFLRAGLNGIRDPKLYLAILLSGIGFLLTTPYSILDSGTFLAGLKFEAEHYSMGHAGMEGNTLAYYVTYMLQTAAGIYILACAEMARGLVTRSKAIILLASFPLLYFIFISSYLVRNERTFLPLTPFVYILAASLLVVLVEWAGKLASKTGRSAALAAIACLVLVSFVMPVKKTLADTIRRNTIDSRETARIWADANLPAGAKIALESYSPYIDPSRFVVTGVERMILHEPQWYVDQGFDYLIFGQDMYSRYFLEPDRYPMEVSQYNAFFNQFQLVRLFIDGGYEVKIYKVK